MTSESAILRAYALLTQGAYEAAEELLMNTPGALQTPAGGDLYARLLFEQGREVEARQVWERVQAAFPDFEPAVRALDAFSNFTPHEESEECGGGGEKGRLGVVLAVAIAICALTLALVGMRGCHSHSNRLPCSSGAVTNFIDRVVTNVVEKPVEIPSRLIITNVVESFVWKTNLVTVVTTNRVDVTSPEVRAVNSASFTSYIVRDGDTVSGLAAKFGFNVSAFKSYNPGINIDFIKVGQTILLPGVIKTEECQ